MDDYRRNLRLKVEALLFSSGRSMSVESIAEITGASVKDTERALRELEEEYKRRETSLTIIKDIKGYRMNVKGEFSEITRRIVAETELPRSVIETLAVIAWKQPILQSEIVKMRTNKAYDHLKMLEQLGFITRVRSGRSMEVKLADKFFDYFEVAGEKDIREVLNSINERRIEKKVKRRMEKREKKLESEIVTEPEEEAVKEELDKMAEESGEQLGMLPVYDTGREEKKRDVREIKKVKEEVKEKKKPEDEMRLKEIEGLSMGAAKESGDSEELNEEGGESEEAEEPADISKGGDDNP